MQTITLKRSRNGNLTTLLACLLSRSLFPPTSFTHLYIYNQALLMHPPTSLSTPIHSHSSPRLDAMRSPPTPITHHHNSFDLTPRKDSKPTDQPLSSSEPPLTDFPQEVTWLFFRDNQWIPFQSENHYKIEQAFTMGGKSSLCNSSFPPRLLSFLLGWILCVNSDTDNPNFINNRHLCGYQR